MNFSKKHFALILILLALCGVAWFAYCKNCGKELSFIPSLKRPAPEAPTPVQTDSGQL